MNRFNRMMALARKPEYLNDYEKLKKLRSIDDRDDSKKADVWAKKMGEKWGEYPSPRPLPNYVDAYSKGFQGGYRDKFVGVVSLPIPSLSELVYAAHTTLKQKKKRNAKDMSRKVGKSQTTKDLILRIDLTGSKEGIMAEVENHVKVWKKIVGKKKSRIRERDISPWEIYDLVHKKRKTLLQITKDQYRVRGRPEESNKTRNRYEHIKRLYGKAKKWFAEVSPVISP